MSTKSEGIVQWFDNCAGYGYAVNKAEEEVFIHYRSVVGDDDYKQLK